MAHSIALVSEIMSDVTRLAPRNSIQKIRCLTDQALPI